MGIAPKRMEVHGVVASSSRMDSKWRGQSGADRAIAGFHRLRAVAYATAHVERGYSLRETVVRA